MKEQKEILEQIKTENEKISQMLSNSNKNKENKIEEDNGIDYIKKTLNQVVGLIELQNQGSKINDDQIEKLKEENEQLRKENEEFKEKIETLDKI